MGVGVRAKHSAGSKGCPPEANPRRGAAVLNRSGVPTAARVMPGPEAVEWKTLVVPGWMESRYGLPSSSPPTPLEPIGSVARTVTR